MKTGLIINDYAFELGDQVKIELLKSAAFQEESLIRRFINRVPADSARYNTDDCTLTCFGEQFSLYPCTHGYLNKNRQWHTRASIFAYKDQLHRIMFQVVDGQYSATNFLGRFKDACRNCMGDPIESGRWETRWVNDNMLIICTLHTDKSNADFLIESYPE